MATSPVYPPSPEFVRRAQVQGMEGYRALYEKAAADPEAFWSELAEKELFWFEKWTKPFETDYPFVKWFAGGKINASYNCIDRHLDTHRKNKVAILWEGEPGDQRQISYQATHDGLTGLLNRTEFMRELQDSLTTGRRPTLIFLDLNGFKTINDQHGHDCWHARVWA